jgi:hypothetical protein
VRSCSEPPPKSPILGDFELNDGSKSPRMGDLGGERKALCYFSNVLLDHGMKNRLRYPLAYVRGGDRGEPDSRKFLPFIQNPEHYFAGNKDLTTFFTCHSTRLIRARIAFTPIATSRCPIKNFCSKLEALLH